MVGENAKFDLLAVDIHKFLAILVVQSLLKLVETRHISFILLNMPLAECAILKNKYLGGN
jgi:hypothetical protein